MMPQNFRDLMRLVHGFESAKILLVVNDLGLFWRLDRPRSAADVAGELGVDARACGGDEIAGWMAECGLVDVAVRKVRDETGVVQGRKPWSGEDRESRSEIFNP